MPIEFLDQRTRINRVGRVRLGHQGKKPGNNGREVKYPVADPYFVLPAELRQRCGDQPTTMHIRFISNDLDVTFPHYMRRYIQRGLYCLGDGRNVMYRLTDDGGRDVSKGVRVDDMNRPLTDEKGQPIAVACEGDMCPHYEAGECKPTGYLRFLVEELLRWGYYDLVCHQRAVVSIRTQLEMALQTFGRITDIPWLLHRGEPEKVPVKTKDKGVVDMPVRTPWIEIDPEWMQDHFLERGRVLAGSQRLRMLESGALNPAPIGGELVDPIALERVVEEFAAETYEGEGQEEEPGANGGGVNAIPQNESGGPAEEVESEEKPTQKPKTATKPTAARTAKPHWADDQKQCTLFWMWAKDRGLSNADVHSILGLESIKDYPGTMGELKAAIDSAIAKQTAT